MKTLNVWYVLVALQLGTCCFSSVINKHTRITGGTVATSGSSLYIVSIQQSTKSGYVHYCAGTIVNGNWVLTAAHCIPSKQVASISIMVAGTHNVVNLDVTAQKRTIDKFVNHDLYLGSIAPYDIGLLYTKTAFTFNSAVQAVSLPKINAVPSGQATLYGWGSTSLTPVASYPDKLQVVNIPIISFSDCENALGSMADVLHPTNFCTGPLSGGKGICSSDSGGPLVQNIGGKDVIVGVVSWGKTPCGQPNSPSVYVQVSLFIDWVTKNQNSVR